MNNNAFTTFMGNQVWDLGNVFEYVDVQKEYNNFKYIVQKELEVDMEFTVSKITALMCEMLYEKGSIDFNFIKHNYDILTNVTRNTINQYQMSGNMVGLSEYIGGAINLSINKKGFMYQYKKEGELVDKGVNAIYRLIAVETKDKIQVSFADANKVMLFTWLIFDCSIRDIGFNAMKLVKKEAFGL